MKLFIRITLLLFLISACEQKEKNQFNTNKLRGSYSVDLTPTVNQLSDDLDNDNEFLIMAKSIANIAINAIKLRVNFHDKEQAEIEIDPKMKRLVESLIDEPVDSLNQFWYKVDQDSILYLKKEATGDYQEWGVINEYSNDYKTLKIRLSGKALNKEDIFLNLKRVEEKEVLID